jgi:uncharacterized protein YcfL
MRIYKISSFSSIFFAGLILAGCASDPNQPTTLQQQQAAMHTSAPSADALKSAMSKVHFNTPGSNTQKPPDGQALPGAKPGK